MRRMLRLLSAALLLLVSILRANDGKLGLIFNSSTFDFYNLSKKRTH